MKIRQLNSTIKHTLTAASVAVLCSCAATQTALEHGSLAVNTKSSTTIFLEPVASSQKTIFVSVKNTSEEELSLERPLAQALVSRGYKVVTNPSQAHYLIQANVRQVGKMSRSASENAFAGGYGSALAGAAVGASIGSLGNKNTLVGGGIAGGLIGLAADSLVKDVNYTVVTDVQISERVGKGVKVREHFSSALANGASSGSYQISSNDTNYKRYRTRVVSNADKVNLAFKDARPALEQGLVRALSGIF